MCVRDPTTAVGRRRPPAAHRWAVDPPAGTPGQDLPRTPAWHAARSEGVGDPPEHLLQGTCAVVLWVTVSRPFRIIVIAATAIAFLAISFGLARVLAARGAERTTLERLVADEAAGRGDLVAAAIDGCAPGSRCAEGVASMVSTLAAPKPGAGVKILQVEQGTPVSPGGGEGVARVAWRSQGRLPVVQCVVVERTGNALAGFAIGIRAVSKPIAREGTCPEPGKVVNAG